MEDMQKEDMQKNVGVLVDFLKGIASPHRLLILCELEKGEKSVTELIEATGMAQTSMSQHLSKLKEENIVKFRRDHRLLFYSIDNEAVLKIMDVLYHEFCVKNDNRKIITEKDNKK